jgi:tetratricopeptide (TPR) repeat protein
VSSFEDLSARATAAREANDVSRAIDLYKQALNLNSQWQEGWWFLGSLSYDSDQYTSGRDALRHFVELNPNAAPAWGLLGLCEFETGEYGKSLDDIRRSLSLGGSHEPQMDQVLRYHEALLLTRTGNFDAALQKYSVFVRAGATSASMMSSVGLAALRAPLLPKEIPPAQQDLFLTAGKAASYTMSGDLKNAQENYEELLVRFPGAANVHYIYGCFLLASDPARAIEQLKLELKANPSNGVGAAMLAWILFRNREFAIALPYAQKAVEEAPTLPMAQLMFGRLLVETGTVEQGIEHLKTAEKMDSTNLEVHLSLATAYSRVGRTQEARRERQISLDSKEPNSVAQP